MSETAIRAARPGDGPALARLHLELAEYYVALAPEAFRLPDRDGLAEFLEPGADAEDRLLLVAEIDGDVAGSLAAHLVPPLPSARWQIQPGLDRVRLSIDYLAVAERHRRRGIATRLVEAAEAWGRDRSAAVAITDTFLGSPLSIPFWTERARYQQRSVNLHKPLR